MKRKFDGASHLVLELVHMHTLQKSECDMHTTLIGYKTMELLLSENVKILGFFNHMLSHQWGVLWKSTNKKAVCIGLCKMLRWRQMRTMLEHLMDAGRWFCICKDINLGKTHIPDILRELPFNFRNMSWTIAESENTAKHMEAKNMGRFLPLVGTHMLASLRSEEILSLFISKTVSAIADDGCSILTKNKNHMYSRLIAIINLISVEAKPHPVNKNIIEILDEIILSPQLPVDLCIFLFWVGHKNITLPDGEMRRVWTRWTGVEE